jgi:hypothetical protein
MGRFSRHLLSLWPCLCAAVLIAGCDKPAPAKKAADSNAQPAMETASGQRASEVATVVGPGKDEKLCFECGGSGTVPCRAPGCVNGKMDCPGPCLKLTRGTWIHMNVAGHDPNELWQKFPVNGGKGGFQAWNQHHVGEVVVIQNGQPVITGPCKICGGTTKVDCPVCKGQGKVHCEICSGKKFIPTAWSRTNNPWLNRQPDLIRLKDGQVLLGKVALSNGDDRGIRTRDGKFVHVNASDILPNSDTSAASPK